LADSDQCSVCGASHISVIERVTALEIRQEEAQKALMKADEQDRIQFQHLNNLRREVVEDRNIFISKELYEKDLALVKGFVARQIAVWTLVAGAGVGAMLLVLKMVGH
jgi:hypothetical protein